MGKKKKAIVENGRFTARWELRRGQPYWYGSRWREEKLGKVYLGRAEEETAFITLKGLNTPPLVA